MTLSCSSVAYPAANYTWFKEHDDSVKETGQNLTITNITSELGGNYYCEAHNAIGRHNSTFLFINVTGNLACEKPKCWMQSINRSNLTTRAQSNIGPMLQSSILPVFQR